LTMARTLEKWSKRLPVIRCECGAAILMVPDLKAMNHAIEVHVAKHRKEEQNRENKDKTAAHVREILIEQVLKKAGDKRE
jgi:hypothetical protein